MAEKKKEKGSQEKRKNAERWEGTVQAIQCVREGEGLTTKKYDIEGRILGGHFQRIFRG